MITPPFLQILATNYLSISILSNLPFRSYKQIQPLQISSLYHVHNRLQPTRHSHT